MADQLHQWEKLDCASCYIHFRRILYKLLCVFGDRRDLDCDLQSFQILAARNAFVMMTCQSVWGWRGCGVIIFLTMREKKRPPLLNIFSLLSRCFDRHYIFTQMCWRPGGIHFVCRRRCPAKCHRSFSWFSVGVMRPIKPLNCAADDSSSVPKKIYFCRCLWQI